MNGGSLLIQGWAGVGKSYYAQGLVERLRSLKKKVTVISKTHVASSRIQGCTADSFVRRKILAGTVNIDCLWVDEISQLDIGLWAQIAKLQFLKKPIQFIFSGDRDQLGAVANSWRSVVVEDQAFWDSDMLHAMTGFKIELRECLRSDKVLFEAYSRLPALYGSDNMSEIIQSYREQFPFIEATPNNLCISHEMRIQINWREAYD